MWQRAGIVLTWVTGIGTIVFWLVAWASPTENRLLWWSTDRQIVLPSANFPTDVVVSGEAGHLNPIYETVVTVWKADGMPLDSFNTRRPLVFSPSPAGRIFSFVNIAADSDVEGTPTVRLDGNNVLVEWSVFDPGMAIKFAVLTDSTNGDLTPTSDVGPNIAVHQNYLTGPQYGVVLLLFLLGASAVTYVGGAYAGKQYRLAEKKVGRPLNEIERRTYLPVVPSVAIMLVGLGLTMGAVYLAFSIMRPAIPLAVSSVTGL